MKWLPLFGCLLAGVAGGYFISNAGSGVEDTADESGSVVDDLEGSGAVERTRVVSEVVALDASVRAEIEAVDVFGAEWMERVGDLSEFQQMSLLFQQLEGADVVEYAAYMDLVTDSKTEISGMVRRFLVASWAEVDPEGMSLYFNGLSRQGEADSTYWIYSSWAKVDADAAFASAMQMGERRRQYSVMNTIVQMVARENPQKALDFVGRMDAQGHRAEWQYRNVFKQWANLDPVGARQAALAMEEGRSKTQALSGALGQWMDEDPMAALNWLDSQRMDGALYRSRKQVFREFLNRDFDTARSYVEQQADPLARREILKNFYFGNVASDRSFEAIEEVFDWMGTVATGTLYDSKVNDVVRSMAQMDSARAQAFALQLPAGNARMNALGTVASELAAEDPAAALEFALSLPYADEQARALGNMGWQFAQSQTELSRQLVAASEHVEVQRKLARQMVDEWSKYDREGALEWSLSLSDENARNNGIHAVLKNWIQSEPAEAMAYVAGEVDPDRQRDFYRNAFRTWSREDPEQATEWLSSLPEDLKRADEVYRDVANNYVNHDPMAASEWIATLEAGAARDSSVETLVGKVARTDPEAAFIWAETVDTESKRLNSLKRSVREWVKTDTDAAYNAIEDSKIAAKEKEALFRLVEQRREQDKSN